MQKPKTALTREHLAFIEQATAVKALTALLSETQDYVAPVRVP